MPHVAGKNEKPGEERHSDEERKWETLPLKETEDMRGKREGEGESETANPTGQTSASPVLPPVSHRNTEWKHVHADR